MTKNNLIIVSALSLALATLSVSAETTEQPKSLTAPRPAVRVESEKIREDIKTIRQNTLEQNMEAREMMRQKNASTTRKTMLEAIKQGRESVKEIIEKNRESRKQEIESDREEFQKRMETLREEMKDKIAAEREELKKKLTAIKDERKKEVVTNLDAKFFEINRNRLESFTKTLTRLESVIQNIETRADKAEANKNDVSSTRTAVTQAKKAIAVAKDAILTQSTKTYPIKLTSETKLKGAVSDARQALQKDLTAVHELVKNAHQATVTTANTLTKIPKVDDDTPTSATTTPSSN